MRYYIVVKNARGFDVSAWTGRHWMSLCDPSYLMKSAGGPGIKYYKTRHGAQRMVAILNEYGGGCEIREDAIIEPPL